MAEHGDGGPIQAGERGVMISPRLIVKAHPITGSLLKFDCPICGDPIVAPDFACVGDCCHGFDIEFRGGTYVAIFDLTELRSPQSIGEHHQ